MLVVVIVVCVCLMCVLVVVCLVYCYVWCFIFVYRCCKLFGHLLSLVAFRLLVDRCLFFFVYNVLFDVRRVLSFVVYCSLFVV